MQNVSFAKDVLLPARLVEEFVDANRSPDDFLDALDREATLAAHIVDRQQEALRCLQQHLDQKGDQ